MIRKRTAAGLAASAWAADVYRQVERADGFEGRRRDGHKPRPITKGSLDGDKISLTVASEYQGNPITLLVTGTVSGDTMKLKIQTEDGPGHRRYRQAGLLIKHRRPQEWGRGTQSACATPNSCLPGDTRLGSVKCLGRYIWRDHFRPAAN